MEKKVFKETDRVVKDSISTGDLIKVISHNAATVIAKCDKFVVQIAGIDRENGTVEATTSIVDMDIATAKSILLSLLNSMADE